VDAQGNAWRTYAVIEGAHSIDYCRCPEQAFQAARAFGAFAADLADLDADTLVETLPHFHDLTARAAALEDALRADSRRRAPGVSPEIDRVRAQLARVQRELGARRATSAPRRVVHNDCKINNVLFDDASGEGLCVIDLDTVMAGSVLCDFGDLVRTAACPAPEDETDLSRMRFDLALFRELARGYRSGAGALLTSAELRLLPLAGPALALENAVRFLTDHLEGDVYFRTRRPSHNLDRCRAQLRLLAHMLDTLGDADRIVAEALA
jgi:Ser/Thr protein kinase RdoA (MazF antagonist)